MGIQQRPLNQIISAYKAPKGGNVWKEERMWNVAVVSLHSTMPDPSELAIPMHFTARTDVT